MKKAIVVFLMLFVGLTAMSQTTLDSIAGVLKDAPVQEKVYLHLDNTCYYKGDTIWYKSYVVRADDLSYTDMSRIVYVELVSPDGLVVERQSLIVSPDGHGDGNFALRDSLYSGYYELRAYTKWMLNFCVTEHPYNRKDREQFYSSRMARDFFRQYGTIYSRVVPVYERPDSTCDYLQKYIVSRPKTRAEKEQKEQLIVNFYPEGGQLIAGTRCNVAFEALTEEGEWVDIQGTLDVGKRRIPISTQHQGRGVFTVDVPDDEGMKARFNYHDKDYSFGLGKILQDGCALHLEMQDNAITAHVTLKGMDDGHEYGLAVLCRGVLKHFQKLNGSGEVRIDTSNIPTGVCDLLIIDDEGQPLADRLFFVNHHDYDMQPITVSGIEDDYQPFAPITLDFQAPAEAKHISISVRDGSTDDPTYDTGNIMTDLLLSSDLRGFIAYPNYYFEKDDEVHRQALDLLMMVQGWRRYDYHDMTAPVPPRYQPEQTMTVEGAVYKTIPFDDIRECEVGYWLRGIFGYCDQDEETADSMGLRSTITEDTSMEVTNTSFDGSLQQEEVNEAQHTTTPQNVEDPYYGNDNAGLRHEVVLKGELVLGEDVATINTETTNGGRFAFSVPPFYGDGILFLSAHKARVNEEKHHRHELRGMLKEDEWPDFYVKRDLFYPIFARKYNYYQCHHPAETNKAVDSYLADTSRLSKFDAQLQEVEVRTRRRRGRHAIDYTKPAYVYDAYELYNLATDYGLSFGKLNFRRFPIQVSILLLGNYNSYRSLNVEARMSDNLQVPYTFYRTFTPDVTVETTAFRSGYAVADNLRMNRQKEIRLFTDFELRNEDKPKEQAVAVADVTLDFVLLPDNTKRYTYRDRRIVLHGMFLPDAFYQPDYSKACLPQSDHRRTLYWNPNASLDADGHYSATFYNNGHHTRIRVSTAGVFPRH